MKYTVNFSADIDIDIEASSDVEAREKARAMCGNEYLSKLVEYLYISDVHFITNEHGEPVTSGSIFAGGEVSL